MKKKTVIALFLFCLVAGSSAAVTYSYLTDKASADNELSVTKDDIHVEEEFDPPEDPGPGTVVKKAPRIVNDSDIPVYVRMRVTFTNDAEKLCEPFTVNPNWELRADGYYYYTLPVEKDAKTNTLFDTVKIKDSIPADSLAPFDILVYAESVQAKGLEMDAAWAAIS